MRWTWRCFGCAVCASIVGLAASCSRVDEPKRQLKPSPSHAREEDSATDSEAPADTGPVAARPSRNHVSDKQTSTSTPPVEPDDQQSRVDGKEPPEIESEPVESPAERAVLELRESDEPERHRILVRLGLSPETSGSMLSSDEAMFRKQLVALLMPKWATMANPIRATYSARSLLPHRLQHKASEIDMVLIEFGRSSFYAGTTEVTERQWKAVMGSLPDKLKGVPRDRSLMKDYAVAQITLSQIRAFLKKTQLRFPTFGEWKRLTSDYPRDIWSNPKLLGEHAVFGRIGNGAGPTSAVATKRVTKDGVYDLLGGVWEWLRVSETDTLKSYMIIGGGWANRNLEWFRLDRPMHFDGEMPKHDLGFRAARDAK